MRSRDTNRMRVASGLHCRTCRYKACFLGHYCGGVVHRRGLFRIHRVRIVLKTVWHGWVGLRHDLTYQGPVPSPRSLEPRRFAEFEVWALGVQ
jgi:hypothetical protein